MTSYAAVADASDTLVDLLRTEIATEGNEFGVTPDQIMLAAPDDVEADSEIRISVLLQKIGKDPSLNNRSRVQTGNNTYQDPPLALTLQYLVTAYPPADLTSVAERMQAQQTLLGRVIQTMYDAAVLDADSLSGSLREAASLTCTINEEKTDRIEEWWHSISAGQLQPSVVYDIGPVFIQSTTSEEVTRVQEREINVERKRRD
jgi:hypothetical protein